MSDPQQVNPYIAGSPVTGTEMFFGRDDVFSFIRRHLVGQHRDTPVVLYGQRRTGKTSVLYQLHRHIDPRYRCVFVDLHGLSLDGMGNLLLGIATAIRRSLRRDHRLSLAVPDRALFLTDPRGAFENLFLDEVWAALGEDHLVLMMDEVVRLDEEVRAGRLEREIFDYLRHLMQHHERLNFVFSLGSGLEEMRKDYAFLFSVSMYRRISFLEPPAARNLITQPAGALYRVSPEAVSLILNITSGHPYYTQLICHCLFDRWIRSPRPAITGDDVRHVLAEAIELGSANLTYVWEDSTPGEQALIAGMAAVMRDTPGPVTIQVVTRAWGDLGVSLPEREAAQAMQSLISREVITGERSCSFAVDLQRMWLDKHRRLDWVKQELAEPIEAWNQARPRTLGRVRSIALAAVIAALVGALAVTVLLRTRSPERPAELSAAQIARRLIGHEPAQGAVSNREITKASCYQKTVRLRSDGTAAACDVTLSNGVVLRDAVTVTSTGVDAVEQYPETISASDIANDMIGNLTSDNALIVRAECNQGTLQKLRQNFIEAQCELKLNDGRTDRTSVIDNGIGAPIVPPISMKSSVSAP
jgi:hypothetical protein